MSALKILETLAADYPLLYLDPDRDSQEAYRNVVLRGQMPAARNLAHYRGSDHDRLETAETPAGPVRVATLGDRRDFELALRGFLAAKDGPLAAVPESTGAATLTVFNWPRIHAHLAGFPADEQAAEFRRFTAVKANYLDQLVLLSRGPYSHVSAAEAGFPEEEWLELSDTIRRYHELTHVICRRLYPEDVDAVRDELLADAVGLYAAFGRFDPELERQFLGIRGGRSDARYTGGRLENYTDDPEVLAGPVSARLEHMKTLIDGLSGADSFDLIPALMADPELRTAPRT